jgi:hypothetical protein
MSYCSLPFRLQARAAESFLGPRHDLSAVEQFGAINIPVARDSEQLMQMAPQFGAKNPPAPHGNQLMEMAPFSTQSGAFLADRFASNEGLQPLNFNEKVDTFGGRYDIEPVHPWSIDWGYYDQPLVQYNQPADSPPVHFQRRNGPVVYDTVDISPVHREYVQRNDHVHYNYRESPAFADHDRSGQYQGNDYGYYQPSPNAATGRGYRPY